MRVYIVSYNEQTGQIFILYLIMSRLVKEIEATGKIVDTLNEERGQKVPSQEYSSSVMFMIYDVCVCVYVQKVPSPPEEEHSSSVMFMIYAVCVYVCHHS